jgi:predicted polyphosphate/ATP-dependent NAD kinase
MKDVTESQLRDILIDKDTILITGVIGGQGHIFGRGNVQLSPQVLRLIGPENMWIVATIEKIRHLTKHQLRVDTPDFEFNESITGYRPIIVGWQRELICEIVT